MHGDRSTLAGLIEACREAIAANAEHLCALDRAIGDGDHGTNMKRGCEAVYAERDELDALPLARALERIGMTLVMTVGGAAGPLYGTLLIEMGRRMEGGRACDMLVHALPAAVDAVARRGRSQAGEKTLLDVLYAVQSEVLKQEPPARIAAAAGMAARGTIAMKAMRGRAAFLGDRSIGHMDPGACSCALLTDTICRYIGETQFA
ncbi:dihydroxyacetone kinase DhaL subunit [Rhizobium subbaraonis]|uniref:Dihydroxyacetone kinase DhaL subunit n=1 Tax=Rhizobium subbaraonis TaxID=908946 RepID=A0A285U312_9HYPH|nr:dihydroxyacetone kinase subunit DhaL [Rhizobium subbaraonis]SOC36077.1 dihydroxyacetone kinase DhaL subunit [Rhizobium subbaraonis]